jgi:hypothetical protein
MMRFGLLNDASDAERDAYCHHGKDGICERSGHVLLVGLNSYFFGVIAANHVLGYFCFGRRRARLCLKSKAAEQDLGTGFEKDRSSTTPCVGSSGFHLPKQVTRDET